MKNSTATILILLALGITYTFTMPQYGKVQNLSAEAEEFSGVLDNVEAIEEATDALRDKYQDVPQEEVARLNKALPDNIDTVRLALDLDNIASKYGITINAIELDTSTEQNSGVISPGSAGGAYDRAVVTFSFVSDYPSFRLFLGDLERSLRIINVKEISFRPGESGLYEHRLSVETYWLK